jgi:hypothetical protein
MFTHNPPPHQWLFVAADDAPLLCLQETDSSLKGVQGGGHSPQLHDLPPGADGFPCVAEESDCTRVFSASQLHDLDQVNFQDFSATSCSA